MDLKKMRIDAGMSATTVAVVMGVSQPTVSVIERGVHNPRVDTVARFLAAIGRMELAEPMQTLMTEASWERVKEVKAAYDFMGAGLKNAQRRTVCPQV